MKVDVVIVKNRFPGMDGRLREADRDIRMKGALDIYAASLPLTPIDTGALRANVVANETGVYWNQNYAAHQNYGTVRGVTPKLFANTAYDQVLPGMLKSYEQLEGRLI